MTTKWEALKMGTADINRINVKRLLFFMVVMVIVAMFLACTLFESNIRTIWPSFDGTAYLGMGIFFAGMTITLLDRNIFIGFLTIAATIAVPYVKFWLGMYLPVLKSILFN
jgi:hypothetical protein